MRPIQGFTQSKIEKAKDVFPCLPAHAKNLLKTENKFTVKAFCPENSVEKSEYVYIGLGEQLKRIVNLTNHVKKTLKLQFNMDGLPLFKSGGIEFWPILGKIHFHSDLYKPFVIAAYCGIGKPFLLHRYLENFVDELNVLLKEGIIIENVHFIIEIMCFVCDRPARALVKNIVAHGAFYACERCVEKDFTHNKRRIYPSVTASKRDDTSFRQQKNPEHHNGKSPLLNIFPGINMIFGFSLDFMHLCCLGVMKKLLEFWLTTISETKLSREKILQLTQRLTNLSNQIPIEFQRTLLQSLGLISKWKATEFRFFFAVLWSITY